MSIFSDIWREVTRVVDDVFDFVDDVFDQIGAWITDLWHWCEDNLDWVMIIIMICIAIYCWYLIPELMSAYASMQAAYASVAWTSLTYVEMAYVWIGTYWFAITSAWSSFLTAIYFDAIMACHSVAFMVSEDYRIMIMGVYGELAKASAALGFAPQFLALALQNTRTLVLDVSSSMGMGYDMAQIQWLQAFQGWLKEFSKRAQTYKMNPAQLFYDMEDLVDRPFVDVKGNYMRVILTAIDNTVHGIDLTVKEIVKIRDDINKLVADLPEKMRNEIKPFTDKITKEFNEFLKDEFNPRLKMINSLIAQASIRQKDANARTDGLVGRLKNPAGYIKEIDKLEADKKRAAEDYLAELTTRTVTRESSYIGAEMTPIKEGLQQLASMLGKEFPKPEYEVVEVQTPVRPAGVPAELRKTWFVGDF